MFRIYSIVLDMQKNPRTTIVIRGFLFFINDYKFAFSHSYLLCKLSYDLRESHKMRCLY